MMAPRKRRICSLGRIDFRAKVTRNFFCFKIKKKLKDRDESLGRKIESKEKNVEGLFGKNFLSLLLSFSHSLTHPHARTRTHSLFLSYSHSPMLTHTQPSACTRAHTLSLFALALRMETQIDYDSKQK